MSTDISDINWLYEKYYKDNPQLRRIVLIHSRMVAKKALEIADKKNLDLNKKEIFCAALLHDIGVVKCNAPDIGAFGESPYLMHGLIGKEMLENHHLYKFAKVCERHTGSGITANEIKQHKLPLPLNDMLPVSLLEKLICYADKFFSKSKDLTKEKDITVIMQQMKNLGEQPFKRFMLLHSLFS